MAHYYLKLLPPIPRIGNNVYGVAFNDKDEVVASHISSNPSWLEQDLLNDVGFREEIDTYTKDW